MTSITGMRWNSDLLMKRHALKDNLWDYRNTQLEITESKRIREQSHRMMASCHLCILMLSLNTEQTQLIFSEECLVILFHLILLIKIVYRWMAPRHPEKDSEVSQLCPVKYNWPSCKICLHVTQNISSTLLFIWATSAFLNE